MRGYEIGSRTVTVYRLGDDFSNAQTVARVRMPQPDDFGVDDTFALDRLHLWLGFVDINRGGEPARLYRTTDGGASWSAAHYIPRDFHAGSGDYPLFVTPDDGWLVNCSEVAQYSHVLHTHDGGTHWHVIARGRGRHAQPLGCAPLTQTPDGQLWQLDAVGGPRPFLVHSTDGGIHWSAVRLPPWAPRDLQVDRVAQADGTLLVPYLAPAGHRRSHFAVLSYRDGHWTTSRELTLRTRGSDSNGTIAVSSAEVWTIRPGDRPHPPLITTTDGGASWTTHRVPHRIDGRYATDSLTAEPNGTALLINRWHAPSAAGPWHRLHLPR